MPTSIPLVDLKNAVNALGGFFHAGPNFLDHKHFVILFGLSGTGKTQLPLKYARAVHGLMDMLMPDPFLTVYPVHSEWTDPTALTGYSDILSNRYVVPPFLKAVILATVYWESSVFVVLDEMNLARVEYYFSNVLSCIETSAPLQLHSNGMSLEGSTRISIPLEISLPPNLYIFVTINADETTNPVSDKVLDQIIVVDISAVQELLAKHRLGFGY